MESIFKVRSYYGLYCERARKYSRTPLSLREWVFKERLRQEPPPELIATMRIYSHISYDTGYSNHPQGMRRSTMDLYDGGPDQCMIEWDIPSLEEVVCIGIWHDNRKVVDYDGVFELNPYAIMLLEMNGYDCSDVLPS